MADEIKEGVDALQVSSKTHEVEDYKLIFDAVWTELNNIYQKEQLCFPHEIIWLGGAPGAGKGTNTPFITKTRGIKAEPIVTSSLLNTPEAKALKDAGHMVGDREVMMILFKELLSEKYRGGVIVDGFPRTEVQVECLKLLYHKMIELHNEFEHTEHAHDFRTPLYRIALLYVSEKVSVDRQVKRGLDMLEHNKQVIDDGVGDLLHVRATDLDPELCRERYRIFKETTFEALQSLRKLFHFYFIDAEDSIDVVEKNIAKEFAYQSSLELDSETYSKIRGIPIAETLADQARQDLVERLEFYNSDEPELFSKIIQLIEEKFMGIIKHHANTGHARINSEDKIFDNPVAMKMLIDIFTERGYHAMLDIRKKNVPDRLDPETNKIISRTFKVYRIDIYFQGSEIRRGIG